MVEVPNTSPAWGRQVHYNPPYPAGAYGPSPGSVLPDEEAEKLVERVSRRFEDDERKKRAYERYRIFTEDYSDLIEARIDYAWSDSETKIELKKFISLAMNPALDITKQVAVVYKQGVRRFVDGANEKEQDAVHNALNQSQINRMAPQWNRLAFLLGPVCVIPVVRNKRLTWDTLLPHFYDIVRDEKDPMGPPKAVAWTLSSSDELSQKSDTVVLDGKSWRYYKTTDGQVRLVDEVDHKTGVFPGSILRFDTPLDSDWWGAARNQRLVHGTVDVGVINAVLNFVRKSQNHKLLTIIGKLANVPQGQKKDPEHALVANKRQGEPLEIQALDFDTDPENFVKHIRFIYEQLIESFGIPGHSVTFDAGSGSGSPAERLRMSHEGLTELRNEQIPYAREFEHDLVSKATRMMRAMNHPMAPDLPKDEDMDDGYRIEFAELARAFNDPMAEANYIDWQLRTGQTSVPRLLRQKNPTLSPTQTKALLDEILEEQSEWHDKVTKRNMGLDGEENIETAAQAFGKQGPKVRDGKTVPEESGKE